MNVTNEGPMDGSDTILLFCKGPDAGRKGNPIKSLIDFEKLFVQDGESQLVEFIIENWLASQQSGIYTFVVGPESIEYAIHATN